MEQEEKNEKTLLPILVGFVVVALIYVVFAFVLDNRETGGANNALSLQAASVEVSAVEEEVREQGGVPEGFPADVPVAQGLTESNKAVYKKTGITQYTVSFMSEEGKDAVWKTYADYFTSAGYAVEKESTNKTTGNMVGTKEGDTLAIVISPTGKTSYVQINLIDR